VLSHILFRKQPKAKDFHTIVGSVIYIRVELLVSQSNGKK